MASKMHDFPEPFAPAITIVLWRLDNATSRIPRKFDTSIESIRTVRTTKFLSSVLGSRIQMRIEQQPVAAISPFKFRGTRLNCLNDCARNTAERNILLL